MNRPFVLANASILCLVLSTFASAQHHHGQGIHTSSCQSSRAGWYGGSYGYPGYGYGFTTYEESVYRGMAMMTAAQAQANLYNAQATLLYNQAAKQRMENDLLAVQNRYAKGVAMAEGKANVQSAKANEKAIAAKLHDERVALAKVDMEKRRKDSLVEVDLAADLHWPEALQGKSLASLRSQMDTALGGDRRYASTSSIDADQVKQIADAMYQDLKAHRDSYTDAKLIAAKRYLDGIVRAAQTAPKNSDEKFAVSTRLVNSLTE